MAWNIIVESHVKWWLFKKKKKICVLVKSTWFVCVEVLRAQSTQWGHVERSQFT